MTIRDIQEQVEDLIQVRTVLASVFDKTGLETLIPALVQQNPRLTILSTGGTYKKIDELLGPDASDQHLFEVGTYTGAPEMEGGLVKTLHPKIHAGILGERNNPAHQKYLEEMGGTFIDIVVVNLYPFDQVTTQKGCTFEQARGNIDIGGPTMLRAAAKNFLGCTVVCDPQDYDKLLDNIKQNKGSTSFDFRRMLAGKAFARTAAYEGSIDRYLNEQFDNPKTIKELYLGKD